MKVKYYNDGQVKRLFPYMNQNDWFILGGPSDGNEAQVLKAHYTDIKVIGIEPNNIIRRFQREHNFPGILLDNALWSMDGVEVELSIPSGNNRCGSITKYRNESCVRVKVETVTVDTLSKLYGPFERAILWIDIEDSEEECLLGCHHLLSEHKIKLLNIEVNNTNESTIKNIMRRYEYSIVDKLDIRHMADDRVFSDLIFLSGK